MAKGKKGGARGGKARGGRRLGRWGAWILAVGLLLGLGYASRVPILRGIGGVLTVEDDVAPADLIVVLPSDVTTRPFRAAQLYRRGLAPRVVVPRVADGPAVRMGLMPNPTDVIVGILKREGVPASAITVLGDAPVTSTADEARAVRNHLLEHPARRLLLVTSDYHTRRARFAFRRALSGLGVEVLAVGAPHDTFGDRDWWRSESGLVAYFEEYVKLLYYVVRD